MSSGNALKEIAAGRHLPLNALVHEIDAKRQIGNLSSALRLFVLDYYCSQTAAKGGDEMQNGHPVPSPAALSCSHAKKSPAETGQGLPVHSAEQGTKHHRPS
jgi:predicted DNA-binding ribbon-helix-helix protein